MSILVRQLQPFDPERRLATNDDYQLLWVTRGNAEVTIDFESHRATAGCFYFWAPRRAGGWTRSPDFSGW